MDPLNPFEPIATGRTQIGAGGFGPSGMSYYVVVRGPLGVGKSTVSARLAEVLGADHILIDRILEEQGLEEWDEDRISLRSFLRANAFAAERARPSLDRGRPVILDGCFYWKEQLEDLAQRLDRPHSVFTLEAPLAVCIARDRLRPLPQQGSEPRSGNQLGAEAAEEVYSLVAEVRCGVRIDATGTVEATVEAIRDHLPRPSQGAGR